MAVWVCKVHVQHHQVLTTAADKIRHSISQKKMCNIIFIVLISELWTKETSLSLLSDSLLVMITFWRLKVKIWLTKNTYGQNFIKIKQKLIIKESKELKSTKFLNIDMFIAVKLSLIKLKMLLRVKRYRFRWKTSINTWHHWCRRITKRMPNLCIQQ